MSWPILVIFHLLCVAYLCFILTSFSHICTLKQIRLRRLTDKARQEARDFPFVNVDCPDFDLLWSSQMAMLEGLQYARADGISIRRMKRLYRKLSRSYPELFEGFSFYEWVRSLHKMGIATARNGKLAITDRGMFLLEMLKRTQQSVRKIEFRHQG